MYSMCLAFREIRQGFFCWMIISRHSDRYILKVYNDALKIIDWANKGSKVKNQRTIGLEYITKNVYFVGENNVLVRA